MSTSIIASRVASYAPFEERAYEHLAGLGLRYVEIPVPQPRAVEATCTVLARYGLSASSLHGECDLRRPDVAARVEAQMSAFAALGARLLFVSAKAENVLLQTAYDRLRAAGDAAAAHGVTIILETHPDLVTNAAVALATMQGVDHPNVRINFDTANIYFYNHGVDCVAELRRIVKYVAATHLKDTDGGYRNWYFPALGRGVVPFQEIFALLDQAGFSGPCTIEIEGIEGETKTEQLVRDRIAESVAFLRRLGRL
jgi:inosose dehydratase